MPISQEKFEDLKEKKKILAMPTFLCQNTSSFSNVLGGPKPSMIAEQALHCVAPVARDTRKIRWNQLKGIQAKQVQLWF